MVGIRLEEVKVFCAPLGNASHSCNYLFINPILFDDSRRLSLASEVQDFVFLRLGKL